MVGNISKKIPKLIKGATDFIPNHPRHHGIKMRAHHLISAEGMKQSKVAHEIKTLGYDINVLKNLVFIPCTLQGACYLKVQPHRGNHSASILENEYDDDHHPKNYHEFVAKQVKQVYDRLSHDCIGDITKKKDFIQDRLNVLSQTLLEATKSSLKKSPLTNIAPHFTKNSQAGCSGVDTIASYNCSNACPTGRNHLGLQGSQQKDEQYYMLLTTSTN